MLTPPGSVDNAMLIPWIIMLKSPRDIHCALPTVKPLPTNRLREAESLGRKKESGFHPCVYPRACKIIIFISMGHNSEEKI